MEEDIQRLCLRPWSLHSVSPGGSTFSRRTISRRRVWSFSSRQREDEEADATAERSIQAGTHLHSDGNRHRGQGFLGLHPTQDHPIWGQIRVSEAGVNVWHSRRVKGHTSPCIYTERSSFCLSQERLPRLHLFDSLVWSVDCQGDWRATSQILIMKAIWGGFLKQF